jgi:hypothetical protein
MTNRKPPIPQEDKVLELSSEDLAAVEAEGEVLNLELDDLDPEGVEEGYYPPVTGQQEAEAAPGVMVPCRCSVTGQGFSVRFAEVAPGDYLTVETALAGPDAGGKGSEALAQIAGCFRLGPDFACPACHRPGLSLCSACGVVLCAGAMDKNLECACPGCGALLNLDGEVANSAPATPKSKGKGYSAGLP